MNWTKLLYGLIIALLYVPMVFLGANVFFPNYTGSESYFRGYEKCTPGPYIDPVRSDAKELTAEQNAAYQKCQDEQRAAEKVWEDGRKVYNGWKYFAITAFTLAILLFAIFVPLMDVVRMGLFFGSVVTAFIATVSYWEYARTPFGFGLMLVLFFVVLFYINKRAQDFHDWKKK